jgi:hypothetical protein
MYAHCFMTPILITPTELKHRLTPLIHAMLFPLANILVVFLRNHSQEKDKTYGSLELDAGLRYLPLKGSSSLTLEVYRVDFLGMNQVAGTTRSNILPLVESLFCVMLSSKKVYLVVHQQMWGKKQNLNLCLK